MVDKVEVDREKREGKRVRVGYMKLWVKGKLWRWDKIKDGLKERTVVEQRMERRKEERKSGEGKREVLFCRKGGRGKKERNKWKG